MSKIELEMRNRIINKIEVAGADSRKNAVSVAGLELDLQEQYWLPYLVGNLEYSIKKTTHKKYYRKNV